MYNCDKSILYHKGGIYKLIVYHTVIYSAMLTWEAQNPEVPTLLFLKEIVNIFKFFLRLWYMFSEQHQWSCYVGSHDWRGNDYKRKIPFSEIFRINIIIANKKE